MNLPRTFAFPLTVGSLILAWAAAVRSADDQPPASRVVVGTFDSRAIAVAYANSSAFKSTLGDLREQLEEAKTSGDAARVAELEALGPQMQAKLHRQGFATASVADILEPLQSNLPALASEAGVDVIVSKWDLVYQDPTAVFIDVTDRLVAQFDPDERTLGWIRDLVETPPAAESDVDHH